MRKLRKYGPPLLMISPSIFLIGIFVYGLIGSSVYTSVMDMNSNATYTGFKTPEFVGLNNYMKLLFTDSFQKSLLHLVIFTGVFLGGTLVLGFLWAWVLDKPLKGGGFFRSLFLFPMAVSFMASGVVWRWLLNPSIGERAIGLNALFQGLGLDFLQNKWVADNSWGIVAVAIPAVWQLAGYVMALFLAGFRGIPNNLREAARMDGASEWQIYRRIIFPQLTPILLSAIIIIGHMSLKSFDLIFAITGPRAPQTRVPAIDMYNFQTISFYSNSAAVGIILLLIVAVLVIPYLIYNSKQRK